MIFETYHHKFSRGQMYGYQRNSIDHLKAITLSIKRHQTEMHENISEKLELRLAKIAACAISTASSKSASSITTNGLFPAMDLNHIVQSNSMKKNKTMCVIEPPSSSETFFKFDLAACSAIKRPTSVEPVNATLRMSG